MTEQELIHKLATKWHLSVPERRLLPHGKAKASLIFQVIEKILRDTGWYPQDWRPEKGFSGGVIEILSDGRCRIHWMAEIGQLRFASIGVQECVSPLEAAAAWLIKMFSRDIDGIQIDWDADANRDEVK